VDDILEQLADDMWQATAPHEPTYWRRLVLDSVVAGRLP
jgi:hypothetical protein